jgi:putative ABC transport system permease protein
MRVLLLIAARNLLQARRRTAMLATAIGLVTMMLVLLMAISEGISDNLVQAATTMSGGHVNVAGFYKATPGSAMPLVTDVSKVREIVEKNTPDLDYVIDRQRGWGKLISETDSLQTGVSGIHAAEEDRFFERLQLAKESEYKEGGRDEVLGDPRRLAEPNTVLLFANQAKRLEVTVGDTVTFRTEMAGGRSNTADATVVAVAKDVGLLSSFAVFVPASLCHELYQTGDDVTGAVWVYLHDIDDAEATMKHLREVFAKEGYTVRDHEAAPFFMKFEAVAGEDWVGQQMDITTWKDEVAMLTTVITAFDTVTGFLIAILVVIIAVGITNAMWNAVRERTREVGTMRAIGMRRGRVAALFLIEAVLLGLFATTSGAAAGTLVALAIDAMHIEVPVDAMKAILLSDTIHLVVTPASLAGSIVALTSFTALAALWPSIRAALLRPVIALGHVE